jgi:signal transduction histidine kinase
MTTAKNETDPPAFLKGKGETIALVRDLDWSANPLGPISQWPVSLRTIVSLLLHSAFPSLLFWGEELICFYNDAFIPSLGVNGKHPSIGKKGSEMWADIWPTIFPLMQKVLTTGEAIWFEDALVPFYRNGRTEDIYWTFSYSPAYNDQGETNGVFVTCFETTEKIAAFRNLEENRNELAFAIDAAELATWDYNPLTNKFAGNNRLREWFGLPSTEEIILDTALDNIRADLRPAVVAAITRAIDPALRERYDIEYTIVNPSTGESRDVRAKGKAYFDEGRAIRFNGTLQDITEQKIAEQREGFARRLIEENERSFRNTILRAPLAICILKGRDFIVDIANDRMFELWGKSADTMLHKPMFEGIPEARNQGFEQLLEQVYTTGESYSAQNIPVQLNRNGEISHEYVDFLFEVQQDTNGSTVGILAVAILVTPQVTALRHIEEIVAIRTADLAAANQHLQRSNAELSQYAHITSHDLQEPIRKAGIFTTMLKNSLGELSPANETYFEKISNSHRRILSLIKDILNYSEIGAHAPVFEPVDLQEIVDEVLNDYELQISQKNATLTAKGLPVLVAQPLQMVQLFSNLISNALKFARQDVQPAISITGWKEGGSLHITVADNGIGFDQKYAGQIFNIFQRLHRQADYSGNGIGLALVRKIMENHQGTITVSSQTGVGTTFHLEFPFLAVS